MSSCKFKGFSDINKETGVLMLTVDCPNKIEKCR